jgi:putative phosphoribosyl transferase
MKHPYFFRNRSEAGKKLAHEILALNLQDPLVLALPRGGLPIAKEVALKLNAPLDVLIVRKIGAPFNLEYGIGAMSEDLKPLFRDDSLISNKRFSNEIKDIVQEEKQEVKRRIYHYRENRLLPRIMGRTVILVDDGIATGITAAAAAQYVWNMGPKQVIVASPVGPEVDDPLLKKFVSHVFCIYRPKTFTGVGQWYLDFSEVSDAEVMSILREFHPDGDGRMEYT